MKPYDQSNSDWPNGQQLLGELMDAVGVVNDGVSTPRQLWHRCISEIRSSGGMSADAAALLRQNRKLEAELAAIHRPCHHQIACRHGEYGSHTLTDGVDVYVCAGGPLVCCSCA